MTVRSGSWIYITHDSASADLHVLLTRHAFAATAEVYVTQDARQAEQWVCIHRGVGGSTDTAPRANHRQADAARRHV